MEKVNIEHLEAQLAEAQAKLAAVEQDAGRLTLLNMALERKIEKAQRENEELRNAIDQEMVITHLGVFNRGDDPVKAIKELMLWSQEVGEYFAKEELAALKASAEQPVAVVHEVYVAPNSDGKSRAIVLSDERLSQGAELYVTPLTATALVEDFKRRVIDVVNYESESGTSLVSIIESLPLIQGKK